MTITLDIAGEQVSVELDGTTTVIDWSTITASDAWNGLKSQIHVVLDNIDPDTMANIELDMNQDAFLDNLCHHVAQQRETEDDYYNERNMYKLYRLLKGESDADIEEDLQNIETQRITLEQGKFDYKDNEDTVIEDHVNKLAANSARAVVEKQLNDAQYNYDSTVIILSGYDSGNGLIIGDFSQFLPGDLQTDVATYVADQLAANELVVAAAAKTKELNEFQAQLDFITQEIANLDPMDPNYAGDLADLEAQQTAMQGNVDAASNDLDVINFNLNNAQAQIKVDEVPVVDGLSTFRDDTQELIDTLTAQLADMPYYENLGDAPTKTPIALVNSLEMRKMIYAVQDETKPQINLRNVSPTVVRLEYDAKGNPIPIS